MSSEHLPFRLPDLAVRSTCLAALFLVSPSAQAIEEYTEVGPTILPACRASGTAISSFRVKDGDTFAFHCAGVELSVRLAGVSAIEAASKQTTNRCKELADQARDALRDILRQAQVVTLESLTPAGRDAELPLAAFGRLAGTVLVDGRDIRSLLLGRQTVWLDARYPQQWPEQIPAQARHAAPVGCATR